MPDNGDPNHETLQVAVSVADILDRPGGSRQRQLLFGEPVAALEEQNGHVLVRAARDNYGGYMRASDLGPYVAPTHKVASLATQFYVAPDFKSQDLVSLSFGSALTIVGEEGRFLRTREGAYIPAVHLVKVNQQFADPVSVAELFIGTPYLWGGNSRIGIDCSGLVQVACLACGIDCPGDSSDQERLLGDPVPPDDPPLRGDLLFWRRHVAMMVNERDMIHSNAFHMSTVCEPALEAAQRIEEHGNGQLTSRRRLRTLH